MKKVKTRSNQQLRTRKELLAAASRLMKQGRLPNMDEVAEEALVSRPTAYRYFPSINALLSEAAVDAIMPDSVEAVHARSNDPEERLLAAEAAMHKSSWANEAQLRVMLANSVNRDPADKNVPVRQNRRLPLIEEALAPAHDRLSRATYRRLCAALALIFGTESLIVFRDVLRVNEATARDVKAWAIRTLVRGALAETVEDK